MEIKMKRKIKICWTCSDYVYHEHKYKWAAYLCGKIQYLLANIKYILLKLYYFRKDSIWPSRKWNWNYTDYIDLSG